MRQKLEELQKALGINLVETEKAAVTAKESAIIINEGAASSPSASGDREHSANQALMNQEKLQRYQTFMTELEENLDKPIPEKAEPICFVEFENKTGQRMEVYLVGESITLSGFNLITPQSPVGQSLLGKRENEEFEFGRVLKIE